ncbi:MAG: DUF4349 domain-containing protein [Pirellulales bacterium]
MLRAHLFTRVLVVTACIAIVGCGVKSAADYADTPTRLAAAGESYRGEPKREGEARPAVSPGVEFRFAAGNAEGAAGAPMVDVAAGLTRKIIYNATIDLVVEDFAGVGERVLALVKAHEGYIASSNLAGASGENRRATWSIRIPVERYEVFLNAAKGLGELTNAGTTSHDVSEEYYDVEARIRNKTKEEERLLALLEQRPGKLEDVIAIERELSRVREELERMQGRMRVLTDLTALTTVNLSIVEIRDYVPPQAPTLATRVRRAFQESTLGIRDAGEQLVVGAVALAPWGVVAAAVLCPVYLAGRRLLRGRREQRASLQAS